MIRDKKVNDLIDSTSTSLVSENNQDYIDTIYSTERINVPSAGFTTAATVSQRMVMPGGFAYEPSISPPKGFPDDGTYRLGVILLKGGNTEKGIKTGYNGIAPISGYVGGAEYILGQNGNVITPDVTVEFHTRVSNEQPYILFRDSQGKITKKLNYQAALVYVSEDGKLLMIQDLEGVAGGTDHDWYIFASASMDVKSLSGQKLTHYWGGKSPDPYDTYDIGNLHFNHEGDGGGGGGDDGGGGFDPCFLAGTLIETSTGSVAVELLSVGDDVTVFGKAGQRARGQIIWTGKGHVEVKPGLPDDLAGWPVHILKDALGENCPDRDLLLTPEHSLFLEECFVPVRMLVNGRSIFYDRSITSYDYYHFKTEKHSVVRANNVPTETYLDTGDHGNFISDKTVERSTWEKDAYAPLNVARNFVEPLYRRFDDRAEELGLAAPSTSMSDLIDDAGLRLVLPDGREIAPVRTNMTENGIWFGFHIGRPVPKVILSSRTSRPVDVIGPFVDERRALGVLVGRIDLFTESGYYSLAPHLYIPELLGWHTCEPERPHCRWTQERADLPLYSGMLDYAAEREEHFLAIEILSAGPYQNKKEAMRSFQPC